MSLSNPVAGPFADIKEGENSYVLWPREQVPAHRKTLVVEPGEIAGGFEATVAVSFPGEDLDGAVVFLHDGIKKYGNNPVLENGRAVLEIDAVPKMGGVYKIYAELDGVIAAEGYISVSQYIPPDAVIFTNVTATSPLAAGYAANIKVTIEGINIADKAIRISLADSVIYEGRIPDTVTGNYTTIIKVPIEVMQAPALQVLKDKVFDLAVKAVDIGETAAASAPITISHVSHSMWTVWSEDADGLLRLKFNGNIQGSKNVSVYVDGILVGSQVTADNKVLTDFPVASVTDDTAILVKGIKFPMFISYSFGFNTKYIAEPAPLANLALNCPVTASGTADNSPAANAVDGKTNTRFSSNYSDNAWFRVDLGSVKKISSVRIRWEAAYGKAYKIQVSDDGSAWTDVFSTEAGTGGIENIEFSTPVYGRYVRMQGVKRATGYGFSFWEFEVYGE